MSVCTVANHFSGPAAGETATILNQKSFARKSVAPINFGYVQDLCDNLE